MLHVFEGPVVIDPGNPRYGEDRDERLRVIGPRGHNALRLVDRTYAMDVNQAIPAAADAAAGVDEFRVQEDAVSALAWHGAYSMPLTSITVFRRLSVNDVAVLIDDWFEADASEPRDAELVFVFAAACHLETDQRGLVVSMPTGPSLRMTACTDTGRSARPVLDTMTAYQGYGRTVAVATATFAFAELEPQQRVRTSLTLA